VCEEGGCETRRVGRGGKVCREEGNGTRRGRTMRECIWGGRVRARGGLEGEGGV
jgi:hypothetical protein